MSTTYTPAAAPTVGSLLLTGSAGPVLATVAYISRWWMRRGLLTWHQHWLEGARSLTRRGRRSDRTLTTSTRWVVSAGGTWYP